MEPEVVGVAGVEVARLREALEATEQPDDNSLRALADVVNGAARGIRRSLGPDPSLADLRVYRAVLPRLVGDVRRLVDDPRVPSGPATDAVFKACDELERVNEQVERLFRRARRVPLQQSAHGASWETFAASRGVVSYDGDAVADLRSLYRSRG